MATTPTQPPLESSTDIAHDVVRMLTDAGETVAVAESLTGGAVMATLTAIPGVGSVFHGGLVTYDTPLKTKLLGVDDDLVEKEGVIHADVAAQMAEGARRIMNYEGGIGGDRTWGLGTTGVAGPSSQDGQPMGTVYIGISSGQGSVGHGPFWFPGTREQVIDATVREALKLLRGALLAKETEGRE
jgi:nicotinamide-nucleotide amidase